MKKHNVAWDFVGDFLATTEKKMVERIDLSVGENEMTFETGRIAKQAHGSVLVTCGGTVVLSAVVVSPEARPGQSFFPMTVDYREKSFAAGKIPGNFFRREGRPTEREILVCRLTDRPLRPLFPKGFLNELLVCQTVFSADNENDPDILSINAASAALHISKVPFAGPIGAVRVGMIEGEFIINPKVEQQEESTLDLVLAGTKDAIVMVEGQAEELTESDMLEALERGHTEIKRICEAIESLREKAGVEKLEFESPETDAQVVADVEELAAGKFADILTTADKQAREDATSELKTQTLEALAEKYGEESYEERCADAKSAFGALEKRLMREKVVQTKKRVDGRALDEIRNISIEVGILPRAHGSCLFTRGETQAIVSATLGTSRDEQRLDELTGEAFRRFMLHYNFPCWSVGEVRRIMGPGRREIGHGKLAERALENVLPHTEDDDDFPYTIRLVSDITESNGSSSMASVCGGTLSLMDAGVPLKAPVAGIAMGLIKEGDDACVLSDILGLEDHLGDMDFKVCGTRKGITAFQMDVKIADVTRDLMSAALEQAKEGRLFILDKMDECLAESRPEISPYAPRIHTVKIPVDKIRDIIGPGGKVIREIQSTSGAEINVEDDGTVTIAAAEQEAADLAIKMIKDLTAEVEVGKIYHGTVVRIMNFGAFVSLVGNKDGLVHISELEPGRVEQVTDVVDVGDEIDVKVMEIDSMGRVNLSKLMADVELGRVPEEAIKDRPPRRERSDKGGDRGGRGRGGDRGGGRGRGDRNRR